MRAGMVMAKICWQQARGINHPACSLLSYPLFRETQGRKIDRIVAFDTLRTRSEQAPRARTKVIRDGNAVLFPPVGGKMRLSRTELPAKL
jgi:hypothetical protein